MKVLIAFVFVFFSSFAFSHEVDADFFESDQKQFKQLKKELASAENTPKIWADWQEIIAHSPELQNVKLYVSPDMELGRVFSNNSIVIHPDLEKFSKGYRFFILLHEAGHLVKRHDDALVKLFASLNPKDSNSIDLSKVSKVTHALEFEADAYAIRRMYDFGLELSQVWELFKELSLMNPSDTVSHPAPKRRVEAMKAITF